MYSNGLTSQIVDTKIKNARIHAFLVQINLSTYFFNVVIIFLM